MRRLASLITTLTLAACGDNVEDPKWTVFVYGHADHNLSASLVKDMAEMSKARLASGLDIIVLADWDSSQMAADGKKYPSGAEWYRIVGNGATPVLLETEPELDLDDPKVLERSIKTAFGKYPADRYGLILWDHGGAWEGGFGSDSQNGTATAPVAMSAPKVADAVEAGLASVGLTGKRPLEFLAFDTCLMGGVEVVSELADLAEVYIANAEIDYGDGWDYENTMTFLDQHPDIDAVAFAKKEVQLWDAHHASATTSDKLLRSHIAIDLTKLGAFRDAYRAMGDTWLGNSALAGVELGRNAFFSLPAYSSTVEAIAVEPSFRDVGQFLDRMIDLRSAPDVAAKAMSARTALDAMTIGESLGSLRVETGQAGLHVELSLASKLTPDRLAAYQQRAAAWAEATHWGQCLMSLVGMSDTMGPTIDHEIVNGTNPDPEHLPTINFSVDDLDAAEARVEVAVRHPTEPNVIVRHGLIGAGVVGPAGKRVINPQYSFVWDASVPAITNGADGLQPVFIMSWIDLGADETDELRAPILAMPGFFTTADGERAQGVLLFQDGDVGVELAVITEPESITFPLAELRAMDPTITFTPIRPATDLATGDATAIEGTPFAIPATGQLPVTFAPAPAGNYVLVTTARDVWGNDGVVSGNVTIRAPIQR